MERAHRDAERYHEDHYNPAFYVKERKRAVLLFLLFSDTFGVLVIKPFENKQKEEKEHDCGLSYLEKPVLGICQPCHYSYPEDIYNPQNEMFRLFETKRLFSKTKCSFFYIPYPFQHYKL